VRLNLIHDVLPRALHERGVARHQIRAGDLQIDGRLLVRLVPRIENAPGRFPVPRFEAFLAAGCVVLNKKDSAVPLEQAIFHFHRHLNG
jgi:hypothetical protein